MILIRPTRYGTGAKLLGDEIDLSTLHEVLHEIANERVLNSQLYEYMLCLAYDVRKACEGQRDTLNLGYENELIYRSVKITWPALLLQVGMFRWAAKFQPTTTRQHSFIYALESQIEAALVEYESKLGPEVYDWFTWFDGFPDNYLTQYLYELDRRYLELPNGKQRFKQLLPMLRTTYPISGEYQAFSTKMEAIAKQRKCSVHELSYLYDNEIDFKW